MVKKIGARSKATIEGAVGSAEKQVGSALGNRDLERKGVKHQADAKIRTKVAQAEEWFDTIRIRLADRLEAAGEHPRP